MPICSISLVATDETTMPSLCHAADDASATEDEDEDEEEDEEEDEDEKEEEDDEEDEEEDDEMKARSGSAEL
jgi:hypothetical protein